MNFKKSSRRKVVKSAVKPARPRRAATRAKTVRKAVRPATARITKKSPAAAKRKVATLTKATGKPARGTVARKVAKETPPGTMRTEAHPPEKLETVRIAGLEIPAILMESDTSPEPAAGVTAPPPARSLIAPTRPPTATEEVRELPEAYGTKELMLVARDSHWLYAHWDLNRHQQREYNARSAEGHLILRVFAGAIGGQPVAQVHIHPESRHWFVSVPHGGMRYLAELGYHEPGGKWVTISTSGAAVTPPEEVAPPGPVKFATIPVDVPFKRLAESAKRAGAGKVPLAEAVARQQASRPAARPEAAAFAAEEWTPEQERALAEAMGADRVQQAWINSQELAGLARGRAEGELAAGAAAQGAPLAGAQAGISSPMGGTPAGRKGFWFNVNAELVVYGATEPGAKVTLAGQPIKLRLDGTFSCRFALPDGQYDLSAVAVSADETDARAAELKFSRATEYRGEVGTQPQYPKLKPPPEDV